MPISYYFIYVYELIGAIILLFLNKYSSFSIFLLIEFSYKVYFKKIFNIKILKIIFIELLYFL